MSSAGTSASAPTTKAANWLKTGAPAKSQAWPQISVGTSLDGDLRVPLRGAAPRSRPPGPRRRRRRRDPVFVYEHERRDQLALGVQEMHLRGGRHHVGEHVADSRAELVDQLDDALAVAAQFFLTIVGFAAGRANRTRSSPSSIEAPAVSRRARTRGSEISRR